MDTAQIIGGVVVQVWLNTPRDQVGAPDAALLFEFPSGSVVCGMACVNGQLIRND